jgi:hypothetical protein
VERRSFGALLDDSSLESRPLLTRVRSPGTGAWWLDSLAWFCEVLPTNRLRFCFHWFALWRACSRLIVCLLLRLLGTWRLCHFSGAAVPRPQRLLTVSNPRARPGASEGPETGTTQEEQTPEGERTGKRVKSEITFRSAWAAKLYDEIPDKLVFDRDVFLDFATRRSIDYFGNLRNLRLEQAWQAALKQLEGKAVKNSEIARKRDQLLDYVHLVIAHLARYYEKRYGDNFPLVKAAEEFFDDPIHVEFGHNTETFINSVRLCSKLSEDLEALIPPDTPESPGVSAAAKEALQKLSNTAWSYVEAVAVENEAATRWRDETTPFEILKEARGLKVDLFNRPDAPPPIAAPPRSPVHRDPVVTPGGLRGPRPPQEPQNDPGVHQPSRSEPPRIDPHRFEFKDSIGGLHAAQLSEPQDVDPRGTWEQLDELERQGTWDQWDAVRLAD